MQCTWFAIVVGYCFNCVFSNLITFVGSASVMRDVYVWHGYVYVAGLFIVASLRTVILQQYWHMCFYTGQQLRSAMIGVVYRKVYNDYYVWLFIISSDLFMCLLDWPQLLVKCLLNCITVKRSLLCRAFYLMQLHLQQLLRIMYCIWTIDVVQLDLSSTFCQSW